MKEIYEIKKPKSTLLTNNTRGSITTKQSPGQSLLQHRIPSLRENWKIMKNSQNNSGGGKCGKCMNQKKKGGRCKNKDISCCYTTRLANSLLNPHTGKDDSGGISIFENVGTLASKNGGNDCIWPKPFTSRL